MKTKIKHVGTVPQTIIGQSYRGIVKENDIIEVNETDMNRLLGKRHNGKPIFEAVKKAEPKKEPAKQDKT